MNRHYQQGFEKRCAEEGVDSAALAKFAQTIGPAGGQLMAPAAGPDRVSRRLAGVRFGHPGAPPGYAEDIMALQQRSAKTDRRMQTDVAAFDKKQRLAAERQALATGGY